MNYKEYNHNVLKEALSRLPEHRPPASLWARIEPELASGEKDNALQDALDALPVYSPPPSVWEGIEQGLEQKNKAPRIRRLGWVAAAASIAAAVAWAVLLLTTPNQPDAVYAYDTEQARPSLLGNNWDADEAALHAVYETFSRDPVAKRQQQHGRILEEWEELEEAKAEIKEIMELYGKDVRLVRQMSEIERERSKLARAMATAI